MNNVTFIATVSAVILLILLGKISEPTSLATFEYYNESDFNQGTYNNTFYNSSGGFVQLSLPSTSGTYDSDVKDANYSSTWNNITWTEGAPYGEELPDSQGAETVIGGANMTGNSLLLHMNEGSGTIVDYSGEGNNGTYTGALYSQTGKLNSALGFDGSDDYVDCGNDSSLDFTNTVTLSAWVKPNTGTSGYIMTKNHYTRYGIFVTEPDSQFRTYIAGAAYSSSYNFPTNSWTHIVSVYDGPKSSLMHFINGANVQNFTVSGDTNSSGLPVMIGRRCADVDNCTTGDIYFDGFIDELALFNRTLSSDEILDHYKRGALNLSMTVRSCGNVSCNGETWNDTFTSSPASLNVEENRYFQYRFEFSTINTGLSPELYNATISYTPPISCHDGTKNQDETDVDCGGICGATCGDLKNCSLATDCVSGHCEGGICVSCSDGVKDHNETDIDCGGPYCSPCDLGKNCSSLSDCVSGATSCWNGTCVSCDDGILNQGENLTDCGGPYCPSCPYMPYLYDDCGNAANETHLVQGTDFNWTSGVDPSSTEAEKSVSYHNEKVIYNFTGLSIFKNYSLRLKYLQPSWGTRVQNLTSDGVAIHGPLPVPTYSAEQYNYTVPYQAYKEGYLPLYFNRVSGSNAVCSEIELWESPENNTALGHTWGFDDPADYTYNSSEIAVSDSKAYLVTTGLELGENLTYYDYSPVSSDLSYGTYNLKTIFHMNGTYDYYNYTIELRRSGSASGMFQIAVNNVFNIVNVTDASTVSTSYTPYTVNIPAAYITNSTVEIWTRTKDNILFQMDGTSSNNSYYRDADDNLNNTGWNPDKNDYYHRLEGYDSLSGTGTIATNDFTADELIAWLNLTANASAGGETLTNYAEAGNGGSVHDYSSSLGGAGENWYIGNLLDGSWNGGVGTDDWASTSPPGAFEYITIKFNQTIYIRNVSVINWDMGQANSDVKDFRFLVSEDGVTFTEVLTGAADIRTNYSNFSLSSSTKALYALFNFTSNHGAGNYFECSEVQVWGVSAPSVAYDYSTDSGSIWTEVPSDGNLLSANTSSGKIRFRANLSGSTELNDLMVFYLSGAQQPGTCSDGIKNQDETDVDCGGICGATCEINETCLLNNDCVSGNCTGGICAPYISEGGVSGGPGGGGAGAAGPSIKTVDLNERLFAEESYGSTFSTNDKAIYKAGLENHTITIIEVRNDSVVLKITSEAYTMMLYIGETESVDLDKDGTDDLTITLNSITDSTAYLTFTKIAPPEEKPEEEVPPEAEVPPEEPLPEEEIEGVKIGWVVLAVGLFVAVFLSYVRKVLSSKKKTKSRRMKGTSRTCCSKIRKNFKFY